MADYGSGTESAGMRFNSHKCKLQQMRFILHFWHEVRLTSFAKHGAPSRWIP